MFGELVALLWAEGKHSEAIRVEQLWNDLAKSILFLCFAPIPSRVAAMRGTLSLF